MTEEQKADYYTELMTLADLREIQGDHRGAMIYKALAKDYEPPKQNDIFNFDPAGNIRKAV